MKIGNWNFIELKREEAKNTPPAKDFSMIFFECVHDSGFKIERSFGAVKPIDEGKFEAYLKVIADEMDNFEAVKFRIQSRAEQ